MVLIRFTPSSQVKHLLAAIEQGVKRRRKYGKQKPTVKVQSRAVEQTFAALHDISSYAYVLKFFSRMGIKPNKFHFIRFSLLIEYLVPTRILKNVFILYHL